MEIYSNFRYRNKQNGIAEMSEVVDIKRTCYETEKSKLVINLNYLFVKQI